MGYLGGILSCQSDTTVMVFGLAPHSEAAGLDLGEHQSNQLSEGSGVEGLDAFVGTDANIASVDTVSGNSDCCVLNPFTVTHQPWGRRKFMFGGISGAEFLTIQARRLV